MVPKCLDNCRILDKCMIIWLELGGSLWKKLLTMWKTLLKKLEKRVFR